MLDLQALRAFLSVAESLDPGASGIRSDLPQAPLSPGLKGLEAVVGLPLFSHEGPQPALTPAGERLLREARALIAHADRIERELRDEARARAGTLRIGYVDGSIHTRVLQAAVRRFREAAPRVALDLRGMDSSGQHQALLDGELDVGFADRPPGPAALDRLAHVLVAREALDLVVPRGQEVLEQGRLSARLLGPIPFIGLPDRVWRIGREAVFRACATLGFVPDIRYEAADAQIALGLVEMGLGATLIHPSLMMGANPGVVTHRLPDDPDLFIEIHLVCRRPLPGALVERFLEAQASPGVMGRPGPAGRTGR